MNVIGTCVLFFMMLLVVTDVSMRFLLDRPIEGSYELVELMMAVVVCLAMAYCGVKKGHTAVEFLVSRFSDKTQALIDGINSLVSAALFFFITWGSAGQAGVLKESESITTVLEFPLHPFLWVLAFCSGLLGLVFLLQSIESLSKLGKK
ncbi:MAG: TRAP transporter small permease [Deltaproteobacteria bacterium]|nr:TRAP transporter small permease [Deltaproteobacteria bacterium]MBW2096816.1 TRAP transporter small permease [Deltaproteobacteria bacterium]